MWLTTTYPPPADVAGVSAMPFLVHTEQVPFLILAEKARERAVTGVLLAGAGTLPEPGQTFLAPSR